MGARAREEILFLLFYLFIDPSCPSIWRLLDD